MFIGRNLEIKLLTDLFDLKKATIAVCRGRRRIGKSTLIQHFGKKAEKIKPKKGLSIRPVLIYSGELEKGISEKDYFDKIICFEDLLAI
ncbi:MAG: hypothetical protein JRI61_11265 [Deltaproteobacteria bacterium]|nr:hypothetical protein [Deltaproteobacteria bacterium]